MTVMGKYIGVVMVSFYLAGCSSSPTAPTPPVTSTPPITVTPPVVTTPPLTPPPVVTPNPLLVDPQFSANFFKQFASTPLRRWGQAPRIYLRTVTNGGAPIAASLLEQTAAALINTTSQWTGGAFGVAGLERGTGTMQGQVGWITVAWDQMPGACGTVAITAVTAGTIFSNLIVLNHAEPICTCGPLTAKHELGHALGYSHTDSVHDVMSGVPLDGSVCDRSLSAREQFHARVAYSLAPNSTLP